MNLIDEVMEKVRRAEGVEELTDLLGMGEGTINKLCFDRIKDRIETFQKDGSKNVNFTEQLQLVEHLSKLNEIAFRDVPTISLVERFAQTTVRVFMLLIQSRNIDRYKDIEALLMNLMVEDIQYATMLDDEMPVNGRGEDLVAALMGGKE